MNTDSVGGVRVPRGFQRSGPVCALGHRLVSRLVVGVIWHLARMRRLGLRNFGHLGPSQPHPEAPSPWLSPCGPPKQTVLSGS